MLRIVLNTGCMLFSPYFVSQLFVNPWTETHQVPLSIAFPRQEWEVEWVSISCPKESSRPMDLSGECMLLGSLSHHNKDLEWRTLKPPRRLLACPMQIGPRQERCSTWSPHSGPRTFLWPSSVLFPRAFPSWSFSHRHCGLLFPLLTT